MKKVKAPRRSRKSPPGDIQATEWVRLTRTEREKTCDAWGSFCMMQDPIGAWEFSHSPEYVAADAPVIGGLAALMAPFIYLMERGTSDAIKAEIETLREAAAILRRDRNEPIATQIETVIRRKEMWTLRPAALAEEFCRKHGWKYDPREKALREVAPRRGGDMLNTVIRRFGVEFGKGQTARTRIKMELAPFFGEDALDDGPRGNIARALENLVR